MAMWCRVQELPASFRREIKVYSLVRRHPRTPKIAKILIGAALAYAVSPIDIIPDFIPVIGHLDDAVIVPLLIFTAVRFIPKDVIAECRVKGAPERYRDEAVCPTNFLTRS
jgi:uncharacterized membrane protein YkvA (DUF1232 family)